MADAVGTATFHQVGVGGSLFESDGAIGTVATEVVSLDALMSGLGWPPVDVVKVDTEGAEPRVVRGMRELSRRNPELKLVVEFSPSNLDVADTTGDDLLAELVDQNFLLVTVLSREEQRFELPRDADRLLEDTRPLGPVMNLLCERPPDQRA